MLNITRELVLFTMCGALLAAGSSASHASNVYKVAPSQADGVRITNPVYSCPAEVLAIFAKADDPLIAERSYAGCVLVRYRRCSSRCVGN